MTTLGHHVALCGVGKNRVQKATITMPKIPKNSKLADIIYTVTH